MQIMREEHLVNFPLRKVKPLTLLLLILISTIITLLFIPRAKAETEIISINPSSGIVETTVQLTANISTPDRQYKIMFNGNELPGGNATGNNANASFIVPHAPEGVHNVTIIDETTGENDTTTFTVLTSYSFRSVVPDPPAQLQEGASVTTSINMTGGKSNSTYPKIKVQTPSGNLIYEALSNITTNLVGDFYGNLTYPGDFSSGANTNFTGEYKILFNETIVCQFFIGLTNSSEYHRGDFVNIKAVDYPLNQNVTVTIRFENETIYSEPFNVTEDIININWLVPSHVLVGDYNLSITPVPSSKQNASDTQILKVPGFKTEIFTCNLANETVPNIFVKAYDESAVTYYNITSNEDGLASFMFERGNYGCEAFYKNVRVGEFNFNITNKDEKVNFTCQLTNLKIKVIDAQNVNIPEVFLSFTYNYTTNLGEKENRTATEFGETDITGTLQLRSLLPSVTYIINASRYQQLFNQNNNTIFDLPAQAYFDATILCPARTLNVNVTDALNQPIINAAVKLQELMGGLFYNKTTDENGKASFNCTFGRYLVKFHVGEILLNETKTPVDLFQDQNISVICRLYDLTVSVKVVDYFGQPISNAKVTLRREGLPQSSLFTESDGTATFNNVIGGSLNVGVHLSGQAQPCVTATYSIGEPKTIEIRLEKYVLLAGFLIETSQFTTAIIIAATVILILSLEVYRRKRLRPQKSES